MDFQTAVRTCFQKYATFTGRAARPEFWWFALFCLIGRIILGILDRMLFGGGTMMHMDAAGGAASFAYMSRPSLLAGLFSLAVLLPSLAVGSRRLHDINMSGWLQLLALIPIIGWLLLLYWYVQPSKPGPNAYS